ncbi:MAG TPA: DUF2948 family protein [Stellaceae bacterium]|nr:DUF2948 family protein [Stellaceae bacterium]
MAPDASLKLRAEDPDDLAVISACVQDALISVKDLTYERAEQRFTLVVNRFRWEGKPDGAGGGAAYERTHAAIVFDDVAGISYRGFRRSEGDRILSLLAIRAGDKPGTIELEFAGGPAARLNVGAIRVRVADIGEPWPTAWQPDHEAGEAS